MMAGEEGESMDTITTTSADEIAPRPETRTSADITRPGARLVIMKLVLENFKSYAGRVELGPFHKKFNCIVGPNGSGKSNVIDALLFVFGFRAAKIRLKKLSMLIHNSDEMSKHIQSCSVEVHFAEIIDHTDHPDDYTLVPNSEFIVRRTANRDNSSTYYIDSRRSNFKEVTDMLKGRNIDLDHNRFLILQGEVEQISLMKPKAANENDDGMLEYLEDIIGTSEYKSQIVELGEQVCQLEETRKDQLKRMKLVGDEVSELKKSRDEAVAFLDLENNVAITKNQLYQKYIYDVNNAMQSTKEKYESAKEELDEKSKIQEELESKVQEQHKLLESKKTELSKLHDALEDLKKNWDEIEELDLRHRSDLKNAKENIPKLEKEMDTLQRKLKELVGLPEEKRTELSKLEEDMSELEKLREELQQELAAATETVDTQDLLTQKEAKAKIFLEKDEVTRKFKVELNRVQSDFDSLNNTQNKLRAQLDDAQLVYKKVQAEKDEKTEQLNTLPDEVRSLTDSVKRLKASLADAHNEEQTLNQQLSSLRMELENGRNSMQQQQFRGRLVTELMKERDSGRIPGIIGRLGDLGSIDDKFDVAISTAAHQLEFILVDQVSTAEKCVALLKKCNLGRATFISLDKLDADWGNRSKQPFQTPSGTHRLFDLVKMQNPHHSSAFYFAMKDTLVAETLDQAEKVAFQGSRRHRVVTLDGKLIETSGTMSGGGNRVERGRMGKKQSGETLTPAQISKLENQEESVRSQLQKCRENKQKSQSQLEQDQRTLSAKQSTLNQLKQKMDMLDNQLSSYEGRIRVTTAELKKAEPDPKEKKRLEEQINRKTKEYEDAAAKSAEIKSEVDEFDAKIQECFDNILGPIKAKLTKCNKDKTNLNSAISKAKSAADAAERNLKKTQDRLKQCELDLEKYQQSKNSLKADLQKNEAEGNKIIEMIEKTKADNAAMLAEQKTINDRMTDFQKEVDAARNANQTLRHECEQLQGKLDEKKSQIQNWTRILASLALNKEECAPCELETLEADALDQLDISTLKSRLEELEGELKEAKPNIAAIENYKLKYSQYQEKVNELEEMTKARDEKRGQFNSLKQKRHSEFMAGFQTITMRLKEMYQMITQGGDAELELVDTLDPFSEGVVFSVRPPKKSWKNISNLSGGEKTLSSLALVFALHHYKPTPFYFMDEIDAALDFRNVSIIANYIQSRTSDAQFIIISLRSQMFELADKLVGIYKTHNATKTICVVPRLIQEEYKRRQTSVAPSQPLPSTVAPEVAMRGGQSTSSSALAA